MCLELILLKLLPHFPSPSEPNCVQYFFQASEGTKNATVSYLDHDTTLVKSVEFKIGLSVIVSIVASCLIIYFTYQTAIFLRNKWRISVQKKGFECKYNTMCESEFIECTWSIDGPQGPYIMNRNIFCCTWFQVDFFLYIKHWFSIYSFRPKCRASVKYNVRNIFKFRGI